MSVQLEITWDVSQGTILKPGRMDKAIARALRKAGSTALRDMKSEASKRIRARKKLKASTVNKAIRIRKPVGTTIGGMEWALEVSGPKVPLIEYPHRQTKQGVSVEVNRGKRTMLLHAFVARMKSGHEGIYRRRGKSRLPIDELFGSRPVDALLHAGEAEAVGTRGQKSISETFTRLLPLELAKVR